MPGSDYLQFKQTYRNSLIHSPKGTTWKDHKYIKKENGRYIYDARKIRQDSYTVREKKTKEILENEEIIKDVLKEVGVEDVNINKIANRLGGYESGRYLVEEERKAKMIAAALNIGEGAINAMLNLKKKR